MPRYEFRCRECVRVGGHATFEVDRPMAAASDPANCPQGHSDTVKLLSTISLGGRSGAGAPRWPRPAVAEGAAAAAEAAAPDPRVAHPNPRVAQH